MAKDQEDMGPKAFSLLCQIEEDLEVLTDHFSAMDMMGFYGLAKRVIDKSKELRKIVKDPNWPDREGA